MPHSSCQRCRPPASYHRSGSALTPPAMPFLPAAGLKTQPRAERDQGAPAALAMSTITSMPPGPTKTIMLFTLDASPVPKTAGCIQPCPRDISSLLPQEPLAACPLGQSSSHSHHLLPGQDCPGTRRQWPRTPPPPDITVAGAVARPGPLVGPRGLASGIDELPQVGAQRRLALARGVPGRGAVGMWACGRGGGKCHCCWRRSLLGRPCRKPDCVPTSALLSLNPSLSVHYCHPLCSDGWRGGGWG